MVAANFNVVQNCFPVIIPLSKSFLSSPRSIHKEIPLPTLQRDIVITRKYVLTNLIL